MSTPPLTQKMITFPVLAIFAFFFLGMTVSFLFEKNALLPLLILFGALFLLLFFQKPITALSLLLITRISIEYTSNYLSVSYQDFTVTLAQLIGLGIAALGILFILPLYRKHLAFYPLLGAFSLIALWGASTLLYSISPAETFRELVRFFDVFLVGFFAFAVTAGKISHLRSLLEAILWSSLIPIFIAFYQLIMGIGITDGAFDTPRIFGTFAHPNVFSLYLFFLLVAITLYWHLYATTSKKQLLILTLGGLTGLLLLLTFSRFAWIATFVFFVLYSLWYKKIYLLPLIAVPLLLVLLSSDVSERVLEAFNPLPDSSIVWRQEFWHDAIQKTTQDKRQLLGYGMSTFPLVVAPLREYSPVPLDAHNDFIKFYVEGGIIGFFVYICFNLLIFSLILRHYRRETDSEVASILLILLFAFICLNVASLSDNIFRNTAVQWLFYVLLGSALSISHLSSPKNYEK